jgi:hypothetical protein
MKLTWVAIKLHSTHVVGGFFWCRRTCKKLCTPHTRWGSRLFVLAKERWVIHDFTTFCFLWGMLIFMRFNKSDGLYWNIYWFRVFWVLRPTPKSMSQKNLAWKLAFWWMWNPFCVGSESRLRFGGQTNEKLNHTRHHWAINPFLVHEAGRPAGMSLWKAMKISCNFSEEMLLCCCWLCVLAQTLRNKCVAGCILLIVISASV